jgi:hypothetical protein
MTENDKNDLKVPCFDSLNKALSRDLDVYNSGDPQWAQKLL